ncbi:MAG: hypothetical protein AAGM22_32805 [Acidobacteriota bacterium]
MAIPFPRALLSTVVAILVAATGSCAESAEADSPPRPELYLPGVVSLPDRHEFGVAVSADETEVYFGVDTGEKVEIWWTRRRGDRWSESEPLLQDPNIGFNDPTLDLPEKRLYFISTAAAPGAAPGTPPNADIWYLERRAEGWSEPIHTGPVINTDKDEYYISFTDGGDLYFSSNVRATRKGNYDLYFSPNARTAPEPPVRLGPGVNSGAYEADPFIAPDGTYLIFAAGRRSGLGRGDLHISFRGAGGAFEKSINLGAPVNTEHHELCPFVSRDGRYFYFTSNQDIYRISTEELWRHR